MTHKDSMRSVRETLRSMITADNPTLFVKLETRDAKQKRVKLGQGVVAGWSKDFAIVWVKNNPATQYEFAWSTIANAVTNSTSLLV